MVKASSLRSEGRGFESGEERIHNTTILGTGSVICERRKFSEWRKNERGNHNERRNDNVRWKNAEKERKLKAIIFFQIK